MTREEAISVLQDKSHFDTSVYGYEAIDVAIEALQSEPAKHGKWQVDEAECIYGKKYIITCSECGESVSVTETALPYEKYCRNCGAKMDKE